MLEDNPFWDADHLSTLKGNPEVDSSWAQGVGAAMVRGLFIAAAVVLTVGAGCGLLIGRLAR